MSEPSDKPHNLPSAEPAKLEVQPDAEKELSENIGCAASGWVIGLICLVLPTSQLLLPNQEGTREIHGWGVVGLGLGAPTVALSAWGSISAILSAKTARDKRLRKAFFSLLEQNAGRLNLMTFSREVDLNGDEAKAYLNERAQEFNATFEMGEEGGINYFFDMDLK